MATIACTVQRETWYKMYIEYSYTQNTADNQSIITHALKIEQLTNTYDFNGNMDVTYYVAGEKFSYSGAVNMDDQGDAGYTITIHSGKTTVTHAEDGTKTIEFSCSGLCDSGGWGPGKISLDSTNVTLDTIARASSITTALNATLGNACSVSWTPASSSFKYKLEFLLGDWKHTTGFISPNSTSEYTYTGYTLPLDAAEQLPSSVAGTMTVYLYTYNGSTQIGSASSKTFTVTVPDTAIPTLSGVSATIVNDNPVIKEWGIAVAGYTKVTVAASANGSCGSTISSFIISGGYSTMQNGSELSYTGGAITSSGDKVFTIVAKDSRGRKSAETTTSPITFYAYSTPKISSFTVARSPVDAKKVVAKADWSYSDVNGKNTATATLYYKKSSATNWTAYGEISKNTDVTLTAEFEEKSSYNFMVIVTDSLSRKAQKEAFVSTVEVTVDFRTGGKGIGIGKIAESDNLEIAFDTVFMGDVSIQKASGITEKLKDFVVETGASGIWTYRKWQSGLIEFWGRDTWDAAFDNYGSIWFSNHCVTLPFALSSEPMCFASTKGRIATWVTPQVNSNSTSEIGIGVFSWADADGEVTANLYVKGTYDTELITPESDKEQ